MVDPAVIRSARKLWNADRAALRVSDPWWPIPAWSRAPAWRRRSYLLAAQEEMPPAPDPLRLANAPLTPQPMEAAHAEA